MIIMMLAMYSADRDRIDNIIQTENELFAPIEFPDRRNEENRVNFCRWRNVQRNAIKEVTERWLYVCVAFNW